MRESQYIGAYLDAAGDPATRWTPHTYLAYTLTGKAAGYSSGYYRALMRAISRRVDEGTVIAVPSKGGSTAWMRTGLSAEDVKAVAAAAHSAVWFIQLSQGDPSTPSPRIEDVPDWAAESTFDSVRAVLAGITPEQLWAHWAAAKRRDGWTRGKVKDPVKKTHPCLVSRYEQLSALEHSKDRAYTGLVRLAREGQLTASRRAS